MNNFTKKNTQLSYQLQLLGTMDDLIDNDRLMDQLSKFNAHWLRGLIALKCHDFYQAIIDFNYLIEKLPTDPMAYYLRSAAYYFSEKKAEATRDLYAASKFDGNYNLLLDSTEELEEFYQKKRYASIGRILRVSSNDETVYTTKISNQMNKT